MTTFLLTFAIVGAIIFGMAVGVIFSNKPLRGSCGGVGASDCDCTPTDRERCATEG